jgi:hypothetical protein
MGVSAEGGKIIKDVGGTLGVLTRAGADRGAADKAGDYERLAALSEQEAQERARKTREQAGKERDALRQRQRESQARGRAGWGRSGVSLASGSPLAVMEGRAAEDEQEQLDLLARGESAASEELGSGASAAARYRNRAESLRSGSSGADGAEAFRRTGSLLARGGRVFDY